MRRIHLAASQFSQRGVAAVEFAIIAVILFTLLFGIMEFGRVLFMMNATTEATRLGARLAVVCDQNDTVITTKMVNLAGFLNPGNINVTYSPGGCDPISCRYVTVSVTGLTVQSLVPLIPINFQMPGFSTTLPRESMSSLNNPVCT
ncbi:TadE/TadG family type IV pilus assembly protein [Nitrosomonas ureae]|uniref:TadE-like protein n=1 Tax=Nitrosomonas ureae TaxID=44577 RepID=A0A1H5RLJ1_9PROT|nr:TadE family protein [Nitrosomonas ureae]SEF39140.1 TadE-like protein [Nitrosomonas ureae]